MVVTIFQINGRIYRFSNVSIIMEDDDFIKMWLEDKSFEKFAKDLIAQIKIGGQT